MCEDALCGQGFCDAMHVTARHSLFALGVPWHEAVHDSCPQRHFQGLCDVADLPPRALRSAIIVAFLGRISTQLALQSLLFEAEVPMQS